MGGCETTENVLRSGGTLPSTLSDTPKGFLFARGRILFGSRANFGDLINED